MKYEDIFAAISRRYGTFTRMEQSIADYVLEHGKDVLSMSISTLAQECNVVDSTVFRFCRTLGVSGYRDFRTALAVSLCAREQASEPSAADSDPISIQIRHIYDSCINALLETYQLLQPGQVDELVRRLMLTDPALGAAVGACASALVDEYIDGLLEEQSAALAAEGLRLSPRFSPGYGDAPLSCQGPLLAWLEARRIGISLTSGGLMLPEKSVTALMALRPVEEGP